jgi:hypothetical protein
MVNTLPVSRLVNVTVNLTPTGSQFPNLSTCLVLGTSTVIDVTSRMRSYSTLAAVATDFGSTAEEYLSAVAWFGQSPQPTSLNIGRWAKTASAGQLIGGSLTAANSLLSAWTGITTGAFKIAADGGSATGVSLLNFSAQTNFNGIASVIQTGIRALAGAFALVTCVYNATYNNFVITSGTTGASSTVSFLTAPTSGVDISAMMSGLSTSSGAYTANGIVPESALAAVTLFDNQFAGQWYGLFIPSAVDTDHTAIASYIEGAITPHFYWINTQETQVLATGDTTHIGYLLQQLAVTHTAWQYSSTSLYAIMSAASRILTTNWAAQNSTITLMYKTEPGITAETLTTTQVNALEGYNGNVFINYANATAIFEMGITPSGQFIDTVIGIDWLRSSIQTNCYNVLYTSTTKVPQTDAGMNSLASAMSASCNQGVVNGLLAPGVWNAAGFGTLTQGQWLDKGYYIYAPPIASQSSVARAARQSVAFQIAAKLAGAIQLVNISVLVNQ